MTKYTIVREVPYAQGYLIDNAGNDDGLFMLGKFLYLEILNMGGYEYFTSWLTGVLDQEGAWGNSCALREEDNKVVIFDQHPIEGYNLTFVTTKNGLLEIINSWIQTVAYKPRPLEVMITQDEAGKVSFKWLGKAEQAEEISS